MTWRATSGSTALAFIAIVVPHSTQIATAQAIPSAPGYEQKGLRSGNTTILPELRIEGLYDSNIFAASQNEIDDYIIAIAPSVAIKSDGARLDMLSDLHLDRHEFVNNRRQSFTAFGASTSLNFVPDHANAFGVSARFNRATENRNDPEARNVLNDKRRRLDTTSGDLSYDYKPNRIGIGVRGGVQRINYLQKDDADRDLVTYRGSVRGSFQASSRYALFAEGYAHRRNYKLSTGDDRDVTTYGFLAGTQIEIANKLTGEIGLGAFRANPDASGRRSFSGVAANGSLVWTPRRRTALTAEIFRGDVATVRSGASGRIDTRLSLSINQEVRHNILLNGGVSLRETSYRGSPDRKQRIWTSQAEASYLLNRYLAVFVDGRHAKRNGREDVGDFNRSTVGIGLRLRY